MIVVFSDLDGTLLDHDSYSFEPARPALALLAARGIPLILASSKTEAEMRPIARAIGIDHPMIVENGAGLAMPGGAEAADDAGARAYERLRAALAALPRDLREKFEGFGDWSEAEVAARTDLAPEAARRARMRRFSEPGLFCGDDADEAEFRRQLTEAGYAVVKGGRFLTVMPQTSKAERMAELAARYARECDGHVTTIALGDAPNDLRMLESADAGVIIANPAHRPLPVTERERQGRILRSSLPGPAGWNEMILRLVGVPR